MVKSLVTSASREAKNEKERKYAGKFISLAEIGGNMHHWFRAVFPNQCLTEPKG